MKIKIYQKNWHKISFKDLKTKLSLFKLPSFKFYKLFYEEFYKRYKNYDDLDLDWKNIKIKTLKKIKFIIPKKTKILSYGSGIGFIEKELLRFRKDLKIECYDYIKIANKWLVSGDFSNIKLLSKQSSFSKYNFMFLIQLLYSLNDREILNLLNILKLFLKPKGKILTINSSLNYNLEKKLVSKVKNFFRPFYYFFFKYGEVQFWGYLRDEKEITRIFNQAGFKSIKTFNDSNQVYQLFKLNK